MARRSGGQKAQKPRRNSGEAVDFASSRSTYSRTASKPLLESSQTAQEKTKGESIVKLLSVYKTVERSVAPTQEEMTRMGKLIEDWMKAGTLLAVEGCMPSVTGARVRQSNGKVIVTDGPFAETKEVIGGLAILQANSKEHAIELVKEFLGNAADGEC